MNDKGTIVQQLEDELDHLKSQLREIKDAGEIFVATYEYTTPKNSEIILWNYDFESLEKYNSCDLDAMEDANGRQVHGSDLCRLVQALDKIEEVKHGT